MVPASSGQSWISDLLPVVLEHRQELDFLKRHIRAKPLGDDLLALLVRLEFAAEEGESFIDDLLGNKQCYELIPLHPLYLNPFPKCLLFLAVVVPDGHGRCEAVDSSHFTGVDGLGSLHFETLIENVAPILILVPWVVLHMFNDFF